jgi:N-acetylmuramoyl-L-alanine amidase
MQKILYRSFTMPNWQVHICFIIILFFYTNSMLAQNKNDETDYKIHTVIIDPGHGGKDSGARGKNSMEKDVVLAIGLKLGKYIEENLPDIRVIYTRKTDEFIPLYRRAEIANENNADLFISIHANGWSDPNSTGTETLVLGLHRSDENFEVAKRENSVILLEEDYNTRYENFDPNSLESYIIFSLMQNVYDNQSISFAGLVQEQFRERVKRKDRGVKRQGLLVLAQSSMPGVLIETGFISNADEEKYITSEEGQDYLASAIYRAFKEYKSDIEAKSEISNIALKPNNFTTGKDSDYSKNEAHNDLAETTGSIYFKVQISSSSVPVPLNSTEFKEFSDVEEFKINDVYKYAVGTKKNYDEILTYCKSVKNSFPDAFIIAVKAGKIISVPDALTELTKN